MNKIQYISLKNNHYEGITCTDLSAPKAFDSFDINIIDLSSNYVWRNTGKSPENINCCKDLYNISDMIDNSMNRKVVIILPQNISFYYYHYLQDYCKSIELKNYLDGIVKILINDLSIPYFVLGYENNITLIGNNDKFKSAFYFKEFEGNVITSAIDSNKATTINYNDYYFTTLAIECRNDLLNFLFNTKLVVLQEEIPNWLNEYSFYNDNELKNIKVKKEKEIVSLKKELESIEKSIIDNLYFKRILIESGDALVEIVFKILNDIFSINLFEFEDKKAADFIFKYNQTTFIGEIKGINTNVKKSNVSQLDDHYCNYIEDKMEDEIKNIKQLLIITHQRLIELNKRQPVADAEITKAKNNNALIIEGETLLKIYEKYKNGELLVDDIYKMFLGIGLLKI